MGRGGEHDMTSHTLMMTPLMLFPGRMLLSDTLMRRYIYTEFYRDLP